MDNDGFAAHRAVAVRQHVEEAEVLGVFRKGREAGREPNGIEAVEPIALARLNHARVGLEQQIVEELGQLFGILAPGFRAVEKEEVTEDRVVEVRDGVGERAVGVGDGLQTVELRREWGVRFIDTRCRGATFQLAQHFERRVLVGLSSTAIRMDLGSSARKSLGVQVSHRCRNYIGAFVCCAIQFPSVARQDGIVGFKIGFN